MFYYYILILINGAERENKIYGVYEEDCNARYLTGWGWFEGEDVGQSRNDVDREANKKWSNGGVDGSKEWKDDG